MIKANDGNGDGVGDKKSPRKRATPEQLQERIAYARELLLKGATKTEIRSAIRKKFGKQLHWSTCDWYSSRARAAMRKETGDGFDDLVSCSYSTYQSIIEDPDTKPLEKIRAQEAMDKLLGLRAPQRVAQTDSKGNDVGMPSVTILPPKPGRPVPKIDRK